MYTEDLIASTIKLFKEQYGVDISKETAEIYLNSLADLFAVGMELLTEPNYVDTKAKTI